MAHFIDFNVGGFKVGSVDGTSGIFVGQNLQYGWRASAKVNVVNRPVTGDYNRIEGAFNRLDDPDLLDTWVQKPLPWTQSEPPSPALASMYRARKKRYRRASRTNHSMD